MVPLRSGKLRGLLPQKHFQPCHDGELVACSARCQGAQRSRCRRSSGVEHTLGKGGVASSILAGGTRISPENQRITFCNGLQGRPEHCRSMQHSPRGRLGERGRARSGSPCPRTTPKALDAGELFILISDLDVPICCAEAAETGRPGREKEEESPDHKSGRGLGHAK